MFRTKIVVYCAVDAFLSSRSKFLHGFENFQVELDQLEIPCVWVSSRSRIQIDDSRRRVGHSEPFCGEDGCGVYLPEDYFHLKPKKTVRLARFTCIPIAQQQPAAGQALELLSEESSVPVVPLRSLTPRELSQNIGLPHIEAELARQRDFDELFFFAGANEQDIARFKSLAAQKNFSLRQQGVLWSLALGPDIKRCIREVGDLYDRSFRSHATRFAIGPSTESSPLFSACDRGVRLTATSIQSSPANTTASRFQEIPITATDLWESILAAIADRA